MNMEITLKSSEIEKLIEQEIRHKLGPLIGSEDAIDIALGNSYSATKITISEAIKPAPAPREEK